MLIILVIALSAIDIGLFYVAYKVFKDYLKLKQKHKQWDNSKI